METCIIKNKDIYAIYLSHNAIIQRKFVNEKWSEPMTIAQTTEKSFSIIHSKNGDPIILYGDKDKNLMLAEGKKPHRMVLRNNDHNPIPINMEGMIKDNIIRLFYNKEYIKESYLTEQHRYDDGSWSRPVILDKYTTTANMTKLVAVNNNYILFYSKKVPEQQIGYREIGTYQTGDYKMLYATGYKILDYSIALTEDEIHLCILIATNRLNKLVYIKKDCNGLSKARTIYEGIIKGCHIAIINSKILITFNTIKGNMKIASYDMGITFNRVERIDNFVFNKVAFIDYNRQSPDVFCATELLNDVCCPYNIRFCPFVSNENQEEIERLKKEIERLKHLRK